MNIPVYVAILAAWITIEILKAVVKTIGDWKRTHDHVTGTSFNQAITERDENE